MVNVRKDVSPRFGVYSALGLLAITLFVLPSLGQLPAPRGNAVPGGEMVVEVRIQGNERVPEEDIRAQIKTRKGRELNVRTIEADVRALNRMRKFLDVQTLYQRHPSGGVIVIFQVFERPTIEEIHYIGNEQVKQKKLVGETGLKIGDAADPFAVEEGRRKIEEYYHGHGYPKASVTIHEGTKTGDKRVVYVVSEGVKQKVRKVRFLYNTIASDGRLKTQIKSKPPKFGFFKGEYDVAKLDADVKSVTDYYRNLGYFDARIGRELTFNSAGNKVDITFVINEGRRYEVQDVRFAGNEVFATTDLDEMVEMKDKTSFDRRLLNTDLTALRELYGGQGYIFADVQADLRFYEEPGKVDLVYNVKEGDRYRVGKIFVQINGEYPHTRTTTVLNRISLQPGDICDIRELRASERRLRASGLFAVNPAQGPPPKITFSSPDQERRVDSFVRRRRSTGSPQPSAAGAPGGSGLRGQSPDTSLRTVRRPNMQQYAPPGEEAIDLVIHVTYTDPSKQDQPEESQPENANAAGKSPRLPSLWNSLFSRADRDAPQTNRP